MAELEGGKLNGEVEMDESYFGGRRKGKRGRGATPKTSYLAYWNATAGGVYEGGGDVSKEELMAVIRKKTRGYSVLHRYLQKL